MTYAYMVAVCVGLLGIILRLRHLKKQRLRRAMEILIAILSEQDWEGLN